MDFFLFKNAVLTWSFLRQPVKQCFQGVVERNSECGTFGCDDPARAKIGMGMVLTLLHS